MTNEQNTSSLFLSKFLRYYQYDRANRIGDHYKRSKQQCAYGLGFGDYNEPFEFSLLLMKIKTQQNRTIFCYY